jgi:uncharacterized Zn finger protein (UPF0148 family)
MTTCPYCNAPLLAGLAGHVICPRCGETVRGVDAEGPLARADQSEDEPPLRTNRQIALMVLAVMVLMASIALAFALRTTQFRRANDNKGQETPRAMPQAAARPADWAGLSYIPDDVHALLGIDVSRLGKSAVGQALMQRLNVGNDALIGQSVDRLLVGLNWKELLPRVTVVVHAPTVADRRQVSSKINGETLSHGRWKLTKTPLLRNLDFWFAEADDFTVLGAQLPSDFDAIPQPPRAGTERFAHLESMFAQRLSPGAAAWLIGELDAETNVVANLEKLFPTMPDEVKPWQHLRGVALSLKVQDDELPFTLDLRARDLDAARTLGDRVERWLGTIGVVVERKVDGDWQRLGGKFTAEAIAKWPSR